MSQTESSINTYGCFTAHSQLTRYLPHSSTNSKQDNKSISFQLVCGRECRGTPDSCRAMWASREICHGRRQKGASVKHTAIIMPSVQSHRGGCQWTDKTTTAQKLKPWKILPLLQVATTFLFRSKLSSF